MSANEPIRTPSAWRSASAGEGISQRSRMVGKSALTSKIPSVLTATTDGPATSGRHTRPASAPPKPSSGNVFSSLKPGTPYALSFRRLED